MEQTDAPATAGLQETVALQEVRHEQAQVLTGHQVIRPEPRQRGASHRPVDQPAGGVVDSFGRLLNLLPLSSGLLDDLAEVRPRCLGARRVHRLAEQPADVVGFPVRHLDAPSLRGLEDPVADFGLRDRVRRRGEGAIPVVSHPPDLKPILIENNALAGARTEYPLPAGSLMRQLGGPPRVATPPLRLVHTRVQRGARLRRRASLRHGAGPR